MSSIMENEIFGVPLDIGSQNSMVMGGMPNSLVRSNSFNFNSQNHLTRASAEFPLLSELQEEPICDIHPDLPTTSHYRFFDSNGLVASLGRTGVDNIGFQGQLEGGTSISATSLTSLFAARRSPQENLNDLAVSISSIYPLEVPRSNIVNNFPNDLNSSFATSVNCGYDEVLGSVTGKWHFEKSRAPPESPGETPFTAGFLPFSCTGDLNANGWIPPTGLHVTADSPYGSSKSSHELSLSLARSQPAIIGEANVPDQCSEISCSGETCHYLKATKLQPEHQSHNSNNLSLSFGSYGAAQFSQLISGSKYLHAIHEILAQIASFSLENLDERSYLSGERMFRDNVRFPSSSSDGRGMPLMYSDESSDVDGSFKSQVDPSSRRQREAKKTQLLTLLQVVDDRYSQCLDEIHTVVSAFHAATELNPPMHARFALQTVSSLYKNLRERISNQILSMGANSDAVECTRGKEVSFEDSFVKEQWALQQLKRKEHQIWRPQRGLPEKSVAVLRTWMFQNFLHPYPKDAEKHLLAVKSGLTRSQVSNWFINARVRLWKPMIEEMYREMNRRKTRRIEEGNNGNHRSQLSMNNQRFSLN